MLAAKYLTETRDDMAAKTTERRLTAFRSFATWLGYHGVLADYVAPKPAKPVPHPLPEGMAGVRRMGEVAYTKEHRAIIGLCGYNGLRISESLGVAFEDFNLVDWELRVRGKGDKERIIPLNPECYKLAEECLIDGIASPKSPIIALGESTARKAVTAMGRRAGICRPVSSHDLRATIATELLARTNNLRLVQVFLGHAHSTTTENYTLVAINQMREGLELL